MDPLAAIVLGGLAGLVVALALLARPAAPGREPAAGGEQDGPRDDLDGMLEALNARRRRRGEAEITADAIRRARP